MRFIKFRGREIDSKGNLRWWVYGSYVSFLSVDDPKETCAILNRRGEWTHIDPKTVGQYTGRKDKNGKEIYDGDILATWNDNDPDIDEWDFRDNPVIVKWSDKLNGWDFGGLMDDDEDSMYSEKYCGIIGNIHEESSPGLR